MPNYFDGNGQQVDAATATFSDGRCKPGFREVLARGESMRFSMDMMDSAPARSGVFMADSAADAEAAYKQVQARLSDGRRNGWKQPAPSARELLDSLDERPKPQAQPRTHDMSDAEAAFRDAEARAAEQRRKAWRRR